MTGAQIAHDWIVLADRGATLRCERCGAECHVTMPAPIPAWVRAERAFDWAHRGCEAKP